MIVAAIRCSIKGMLLAETVESVTADQPIPTIPTLIPPGVEVPPPISVTMPSPGTVVTVTPPTPSTPLPEEREPERNGVMDIVIAPTVEKKPFYKKWWFWLAVAVAAGGAVYVFTRKKKV